VRDQCWELQQISRSTEDGLGGLFGRKNDSWRAHNVNTTHIGMLGLV
jgi:hypothetical protein